MMFKEVEVKSIINQSNDIIYTSVSPMTDFKIDVFICGTKEEYDLVEEERYSLRPDVNS